LETEAPYSLETLSEHYLAVFYGKQNYKREQKSKWFGMLEERERCPKCFSFWLSEPSKSKHYKVCRNCRAIILIKNKNEDRKVKKDTP
jgi:hypothetical protein